VGYIGLIFVEENYRGKGISKKIISNLKKWLKQNKIKEVQIKVYSENKTALAIYRKSGFKDFMIELRSKL
jgi:GNAT superfamily N-acetyltransferase